MLLSALDESNFFPTEVNGICNIKEETPIFDFGSDIQNDGIPSISILESQFTNFSNLGEFEGDLRISPYVQPSKLKSNDIKSALVNILLESKTIKSKWVQ